MSEPSRSLSDIRSDACNKILTMISLLVVPGLGVIGLRLIEQGFMPIMVVYVALLAMLMVVSLRRRHFSLTVRAAMVIAIPFIIGAASIATSGRLSGALMFFVSSAVMAGCFFSRRAAFGVVGLGMIVLAGVYGAFRFGLITSHLVTDDFTLSAVTWLSIAVSYTFAGAAPVYALSAVYEALEAERLRANAAADTRTAFLANMSHELRTPMAGIIGMAEVLRDSHPEGQPANEAASDQRRDMADNLIRSSRNLMVILNDLLGFARFEAGAVAVERAPFRLSEMTADLAAAFEAKARQKGVELRIEFPRAFQDDLIGDGHRIAQVLSNLIDNALKFTDAGVVALSIDQTGRGDNLLLKCAVSDTGIGIALAQQAEIFAPFVQADTSISRKYGGSGLGLAICRGLAQAMGGDIAVFSKPGHGATFTLTIPVEQVAAHVARATPPTANPVSGRPLKLLAAEDDASMRMILEIKLSQMGHTITIVNDGLAALKAASAGGYDCILMDMHMPVMNGPDAVRAIRAGEAARGAPRVPILAVTADLIPERVRGFREAGVDDIAGKPVNWDGVETQIRKLTNA